MHERLGEVMDRFDVKCQIWRHASSLAACFKAVASRCTKLYSITAHQCYSWANHGMGHFPLITNKLEISMGHSL